MPVGPEDLTLMADAAAARPGDVDRSGAPRPAADGPHVPARARRVPPAACPPPPGRDRGRGEPPDRPGPDQPPHDRGAATAEHGAGHRPGVERGGRGAHDAGLGRGPGEGGPGARGVGAARARVAPRPRHPAPGPARRHHRPARSPPPCGSPLPPTPAPAGDPPPGAGWPKVPTQLAAHTHARSGEPARGVVLAYSGMNLLLCVVLVLLLLTGLIVPAIVWDVTGLLPPVLAMLLTSLLVRGLRRGALVASDGGLEFTPYDQLLRKPRPEGGFAAPWSEVSVSEGYVSALRFAGHRVQVGPRNRAFAAAGRDRGRRALNGRRRAPLRPRARRACDRSRWWCRAPARCCGRWPRPGRRRRSGHLPRRRTEVAQAPQPGPGGVRDHLAHDPVVGVVALQVVPRDPGARVEDQHPVVDPSRTGGGDRPAARPAGAHREAVVGEVLATARADARSSRATATGATRQTPSRTRRAGSRSPAVKARRERRAGRPGRAASTGRTARGRPGPGALESSTGSKMNSGSRAEERLSASRSKQVEVELAPAHAAGGRPSAGRRAARRGSTGRSRCCGGASPRTISGAMKRGVPSTRAGSRPSMPTLSLSQISGSAGGRVEEDVAEADVAVAEALGVQLQEAVGQLHARAGSPRENGASTLPVSRSATGR